MNWVLGILAVAFPLVVTLLTAAIAGDGLNISTSTIFDTLGATSIVSALLGGVIAVSAITAEFGFGTIRTTFAATPRRGRVLAAKAIVVVAFITVLQTIVVLVGSFGGMAIARSRGADVNWSDAPTAVPALVGAVVLAALVSLFGYGLGALLRSTPFATTMLMLWPLLAESLIGGLLAVSLDNSNIMDWLPFRAAFRLPLLDLFSDGPNRLMSGLYFGAVSLVLTVVGCVTVQRRDA
jgi:ABC-2 type transport system permease protein